MSDNTVMNIEIPETLSVEELAHEVARLISELGLANQADHRVSSVPDSRTARYYCTLGILDRPIVSGRQAKYGKRHVLQLLAIKGLQSLSMPLSQIQAKLYGMSDSELSAVIESLARSTQTVETSELPRPALWKEIVIEPGLKLQMEAGFTCRLSKEDLHKQIMLALQALLEN